MEFIKYMHIERLDTEEVKDILNGTCFIFPKIDGTNGSIYLGDDMLSIKCSSRIRELSLNNDNHGFCKYVEQHEGIHKLIKDMKDCTIYGEWLIPHRLKTYKKNAWRQFYIFDIFNNKLNKWISYEDYKFIEDKYHIPVIPPLAILINPSMEELNNLVKSNTFLMEEDKGIGEGIVIKNYNFINEYGRITWAKLLNAEFKSKKGIKKAISNIDAIETEIAEEYITIEFVEKEYNKILILENGWSSKYIPRLLNIIFYEFIRDDLWKIIKKHKFPLINFHILQKEVFRCTKEIKPELF